jgi:hypothetical protein
MTRSYDDLRARHRPERVRLLLVGESAPDPGAAELRFFYAPVLHKADNLFRGVVQALFDASPGRAGDLKAPWHARLTAKGIYLIDLVPFPVNKLSGRERSQARRAHVDDCVAEARAVEPRGIVVCHKPTFKVLSEPMRAAGLPLLHQEGIPFPLGNQRAAFVAGFRAALARLS